MTRTTKVVVDDPRFLGVAFRMRVLNHSQILDIWDAQEAQKAMGIRPDRVGELAVIKGVLTRAKAEEVEGARRTLTEQIPDPVALPRGRRLKRSVLVRRRVVAGLFILAIPAIVWLRTGDLNWVGVAATLVVAFVVAFENILPFLFEGTVTWYRATRWIAYALAPIGFVYCAHTAFRLYSVSLDGLVNPQDANQLGLQLVLGAIVLAVAGGVSLVNSIWRHREIWFLESRIDLMAGLVSRFHQLLPGHRVRDTHEKMILVERLLQSSANAMRLNPWNHFLSALRRADKSVKAVSVWYLQPNGQGSFDNLVCVAPDVPKDVFQLYEEIRETHHPKMLDRARYDDAIAASRVDGRFCRDTFLKRKDRHGFISLAGFVYDQRTRLVCGDSRKCCAFDNSYLRKMAVENLPRGHRGWIDFVSFIAYPVMDPAREDEPPLGVLLAFRTTRNGFTPEDDQTMLVASRLIGSLMSTSDQQTRRVKI